MINAEKFAEYAQRGFVVRIPAEQLARREQENAVRSAQLSDAGPAATPAPEVRADAPARLMRAVATPQPTLGAVGYAVTNSSTLSVSGTVGVGRLGPMWPPCFRATAGDNGTGRQGGRVALDPDRDSARAIPSSSPRC